MKLIALIFFITTHFWLNAQVINVVEHEWEADIKVFFTSLEWNADVVVLPTKSLHHARNIEGHWYIRNRQDGRDINCINIYLVNKAALSDLKVFLTDDESRINTENMYNEKFRRGKPRNVEAADQ
jgi:3-dehydroquinate synthase class II